MLIYLLKMIACSAIFYAFYFAFLSKEKMLVFNRLYLLAAASLSFFIPLVTITVQPVKLSQAVSGNIPFNQVVTTMSSVPVAAPSWYAYIESDGWALCILFSLLLVIRFAKNYFRLRLIEKGSENFLHR